MKMNSSEKSDELWDKIETDENLVDNALRLAKRDIKTANDVFKDGDYDWSLAISYSAMLQGGRALMFSEGFRPKGKYKHVSVVEFVRTKFGDKFADKLLFTFNKMRKKRHIVVYEQVNIISKEEAQTALEIAKEFITKVNTILKKQ